MARVVAHLLAVLSGLAAAVVAGTGLSTEVDGQPVDCGALVASGPVWSDQGACDGVAMQATLATAVLVVVAVVAASYVMFRDRPLTLVSA